MCKQWIRTNLYMPKQIKKPMIEYWNVKRPVDNWFIWSMKCTTKNNKYFRIRDSEYQQIPAFEVASRPADPFKDSTTCRAFELQMHGSFQSSCKMSISFVGLTISSPVRRRTKNRMLMVEIGRNLWTLACHKWILLHWSKLMHKYWSNGQFHQSFTSVSYPKSSAAQAFHPSQSLHAQPVPQVVERPVISSQSLTPSQFFPVIQLQIGRPMNIERIINTMTDLFAYRQNNL